VCIFYSKRPKEREEGEEYREGEGEGGGKRVRGHTAATVRVKVIPPTWGVGSGWVKFTFYEDRMEEIGGKEWWGRGERGEHTAVIVRVKETPPAPPLGVTERPGSGWVKFTLIGALSIKIKQ
jgi:hypothetical protein